MEQLKDIVIFYHADCHDGFGGAFSAYKKFGDAASYIPLKHDDIGIAKSLNNPALAGKEVYMIDFCASAEQMKKLQDQAKTLIVLDHHKTTESVVKSLRNHRYALDHSGAYLAWEYFHPQVPVPELIKYIEDGDLYRFQLTDSRNILAVIETKKLDFNLWEQLLKDLENPNTRADYARLGAAYEEHWWILINILADTTQQVMFEGHQILVVNAPRLFRSDLGNLLARRKPPFAIVWYPHGDSLHFSLRGDGSIDVAKMAEKYGGGGHFSAASFTLPLDIPLPWQKR